MKKQKLNSEGIKSPTAGELSSMLPKGQTIETAGAANKPPWSDALTRNDAVRLLRAFRPHKEPGFTQAEAESLWSWAEGVRKASAMLDLAMAGKLEILIEGTEFVFRKNDEGSMNKNSTH